MLKIISIIIWTTICGGYQAESAIAADDLTFASNTAQIQAQVLQREEASRNENLTKILIFAGLLSGVGIIGWQLSRQGTSGKYITSPGKTGNKALIDRVSPKLRRQLLRLINDPKTANRLLMGIQKDHRDRDPDWLAEKVIYDLRRGR